MLNIEWGKLLLAERMPVEHRRIEEQARRQLGLATPSRAMVVVHPAERAKP